MEKSLSHKSPSLIYAKTVMTSSDFNTMHWCVIQLQSSSLPRKRESTEGGLGRRLTSETGSESTFLLSSEPPVATLNFNTDAVVLAILDGLSLAPSRRSLVLGVSGFGQFWVREIGVKKLLV